MHARLCLVTNGLKQQLKLHCGAPLVTRAIVQVRLQSSSPSHHVRAHYPPHRESGGPAGGILQQWTATSHPFTSSSDGSSHICVLDSPYLYCHPYVVSDYCQPQTSAVPGVPAPTVAHPALSSQPPPLALQRSPLLSTVTPATLPPTSTLPGKLSSTY